MKVPSPFRRRSRLSLATTEPNKIPATITSRCQRYDFRRGTLSEISQRLTSIAQAEGLSIEKRALEYIARLATGSFRDATSLLDQLTAYGAETITLAQVQRLLGAASLHALVEVAESLATRDVARGLGALDQAVESGADPRQLARDVVEFFRDILLVQVGREGALVLSEEESDVLKGFAARLGADELLRVIRLFNQAAFELRASANPTLPLEIALVEATLEPITPAVPVQQTHTPTPTTTKRNSPPSRFRSEQRASTDSKKADDPKTIEKAISSPENLSLAGVQRHWAQIIVKMRSHSKQVEALLKGSYPVSLNQELLSVGFPSKFHVDKFEADAQAKALLVKLIQERFGEARHVRCVISPKVQRKKAAEADPLISTAINLGGELVEIHEEEEKE